MRTTVFTDPADPEQTDSYPGCFGTLADDGDLLVIQYTAARRLEEHYAPGSWHSYETTDDGPD